MNSTITSAIISAVISAFVSWGVSLFSARRNDKSSLEKELSEILKIGIEHPHFEQEVFTNAWEPKKQINDERYAAYELYATMVFNHLEKWCRYHSFKLEDVRKDIDIDSWVKLHQAYWNTPTGIYENIRGYDLRFYNLVNTQILRKGRVK